MITCTGHAVLSCNLPELVKSSYLHYVEKIRSCPDSKLLGIIKLANLLLNLKSDV